MRRRHLMGQASGLALAALVATLAAGCQKAAPAAPGNVDMAAAPVATLPLSDAPAPALAPAPPLAALPSHPVQRVAVARPEDAYAFADRAGQVSQGFGAAPPDYAFDYQGVQPWSWRGDNGYQTVVEPLPGGGDRYYYYQPGSDAPFFVRDPDFGYGYQGGALVVVYDRFGRPLPRQDEDRRADDAGRYLWRAQALYQASQRERHVAVARANWEARRAEIDRERATWLAARDRNQDWRAYHDQHGQQDQAAWAQQRTRREAEAARVDQANPAQAARERQAALAAAGRGAAGLTPAQQALAARQAQGQDLAARQNQLAARAAALRAREHAAGGQVQGGATAAQQALADRVAAQRAQVQARQQQAGNRATMVQRAQATAQTRLQEAAARTQSAEKALADRQALVAARQAELKTRQQEAVARLQVAQKALADRQAQVAARQSQLKARQQDAAARLQAAQTAQADRQAKAAAARAAAQARRLEEAAKARAAREAAAANRKAAQPTNATH